MIKVSELGGLWGLFGTGFWPRELLNTKLIIPLLALLHFWSIKTCGTRQYLSV